MAQMWHFRSKFEMGNLYVVIDRDKVTSVFFGRMSQLHPKRRATLAGVLVGKPTGSVEKLMGGWELTDIWMEDGQFNLLDGEASVGLTMEYREPPLTP